MWKREKSIAICCALRGFIFARSHGSNDKITDLLSIVDFYYESRLELMIPECLATTLCCGDLMSAK